MNENVAKIKAVINDLTEKMADDTKRDNYDSYELKIRAIDQLLHAITLIEKM